MHEINLQKSASCLQAYLKHCNNSDWVREESYKFFFANWIFTKVKLKLQPSDKILALCKEALKQKYSLVDEKSVRGVQFLQLAARLTPNNPITLEDIELMKHLSEAGLDDEAAFERRGMSYPALSGWLSSLSPKTCMPVVTTDFAATIEFLFDVSDVPGSGYSFLIEASTYLKKTKEYLQQQQLPDLYLDRINLFIQKENLGQRKPRYTEVDWNWLAQDFHLFVHREYLKLRVKEEPKPRNTSVKTNADSMPTPLNSPDEVIAARELPVLSLYTPQPLPRLVDERTLTERDVVITQEDYFEKYQNQLRNGHHCEQIAYLSEIEHLQAYGLDEWAAKVEIVSANPDLGYDLRSYEQDGREKQIEVKAISTIDPKTFFITAHELEKSKTFDNYYIYCVHGSEGSQPVIYRLKNPDLSNDTLFATRAVSYKVAFI